MAQNTHKLSPGWNPHVKDLMFIVQQIPSSSRLIYQNSNITQRLYRNVSIWFGFLCLQSLLGIKRQRNLEKNAILSVNELLISGKDLFLSSNRASKISMEEYILSTCSPWAKSFKG